MQTSALNHTDLSFFTAAPGPFTLQTPNSKTIYNSRLKYITLFIFVCDHLDSSNKGKGFPTLLKLSFGRNFADVSNWNCCSMCHSVTTTCSLILFLPLVYVLNIRSLKQKQKLNVTVIHYNSVTHTFIQVLCFQYLSTLTLSLCNKCPAALNSDFFQTGLSSSHVI